MCRYSCFDGVYRAWGRIIAAHGVAVVMVDFRNSLVPSSVPEVAPYPAGLNDCISGLKWLHANSASLNIGRITVSGESGGGNLALATCMKLKREGHLSLISGIYALCPFLAGKYPDPQYPSTIEFEGITAEGTSTGGNSAALAYGIDAHLARDPLAWPAFAAAADVAGFPPTVISVNECDPLRDEGLAFHRLLLAAGVASRARVVPGSCHAAELLLFTCPEFGRETARDLAAFAKGLG